ncbi:hypothetical protein DXG03_000181 [Asterophora parasitica]|uniref:PA14 domain-containing protein n=1 Tax=Asterophora parasitica TaxID=117018 RepID=A0A9P7GKU0_9AGAR|nr:hypothetical protein DXG03_000181 [Asterophora parasitica]
MRITGKFSPDEDGDWEFGLSLAGRGNLFLDEKLIVDLSTDPTQGESFFGLGTTDVRTVVTGLRAGQTYDLELRLCNADFAARGSPFLCWGGVRLGAMKRISADGAIADAVQLAKEANGKVSCRDPFGRPSDMIILQRRSLLSDSTTSKEALLTIVLG